MRRSAMDVQETAEGGYEPMTVEEFNALRSPPKISSMAGAIEFVSGIIDRLGVWPEVITVLDPAEFDGELTPVYGGRGYASLHAKMQAIQRRVREVIRYRQAEPMMPELILKTDSGIVAFIWDKEIYLAA
jgi:hypothetical protein